MAIVSQPPISFKTGSGEEYASIEHWRLAIALEVAGGWDGIDTLLLIPEEHRDRFKESLRLVKSAWAMTDADRPPKNVVETKRFEFDGMRFDASAATIERARMGLIRRGQSINRETMWEALGATPIEESVAPSESFHITIPAKPTYSNEQVAALWEAADLIDRAYIDAGSPLRAEHGLLRVSLSWDPKGCKWAKQPSAHWDTRALDANARKWGRPKWTCLPPIDRTRMHAHITSGGFAGFVPAIWGMVVFDIDDRSPDAPDRVVARYGQPLARYKSGSGGWHLLYPSAWDDATGIGAGSYLIDGRPFGETGAGSRWIALWDPVMLLQAARAIVNDDFTATPITEAMIDRPEAPIRTTDAPPVELGDGEGVSAGDVVDFYGLSWDEKAGRYYGPCPICQAETGDGGSTRFTLRTTDLGSRDMAITCWGSDTHGSRKLSAEEWNVVVKPILQAKELAALGAIKGGKGILGRGLSGGAIRTARSMKGKMGSLG